MSCLLIESVITEYAICQYAWAARAIWAKALCPSTPQAQVALSSIDTATKLGWGISCLTCLGAFVIRSCTKSNTSIASAFNHSPISRVCFVKAILQCTPHLAPCQVFSSVLEWVLSYSAHVSLSVPAANSVSSTELYLSNRSALPATDRAIAPHR